MDEQTLIGGITAANERITILELAIADLYEKLNAIQQKEEPTNG